MPVLRVVGFFTIIIALLALVNGYVYRRAVRAFALERLGKITLVALLVTGLAAMVVARTAERTFGAPVAAIVAVGGSVVELGLLISCALLLLVDIARSVLALLQRTLRWRRARSRRGLEGATPLTPESAGGESGATFDLSAASAATASLPPSVPGPFPALPALARREFLVRAATGGALAAGGGTAVYGALFGRRDYRTETVPIPIAGLPRTLDGYTIVQISDIHFGVQARGDEVHVATSLIRRARPDLIVITGDMIDHDDAYTPYLGQMIRRLEGAARHGIVVIPGNHDYYSGIGPVLATARSGGAKVLVNEGRLIGDAGGAFALLGVDDFWRRREGGGPDLSRALASVPRDLPRILLCHNPAFFPEAAGQVALQLSGHTHGGQVNIVPALTAGVLPFGYVAGLYERGGSRLYVNRGFGTAGPPARVGSPPEITRIVLVAA